MLHFFSHDLELCVLDVLARDDGLQLCVGLDFSGQRWLIYRARADADDQVWVCAPESERAIECVKRGTACVGDALRHSLTGLAEIVTIGREHGQPDRCVSCSDIPNDLLPSPLWRVGVGSIPTPDRPRWKWLRSEQGAGAGAPAA